MLSTWFKALCVYILNIFLDVGIIYDVRDDSTNSGDRNKQTATSRQYASCETCLLHSFEVELNSCLPSIYEI